MRSMNGRMAREPVPRSDPVSAPQPASSGASAPAPPRASRREAAAGRDPVLAAAAASILDVGLRRTTLADVARRAGVSRMTVYRQWGDLDAIVSALLTSELVAALSAAATRSAALPTARERLVEAAAEVVVAVGQHPLYRRILDLDPELLLPLVVDRLGSTQRTAVDLVAGQLRTGRRDGSIAAGIPSHRLAVTVVLVLQALVFSVRVAESERIDRLLGGQVRTLLHGWLAPSAVNS